MKRPRKKYYVAAFAMGGGGDPEPPEEKLSLLDKAHAFAANALDQIMLAFGTPFEFEPIARAAVKPFEFVPALPERKEEGRSPHLIQLDSAAPVAAFIPQHNGWNPLALHAPWRASERAGDWAQRVGGFITYLGEGRYFDVRFSLTATTDPARFEQRLDVGLALKPKDAAATSMIGASRTTCQRSARVLTAQGGALVHLKSGDTVAMYIRNKGAPDVPEHAAGNSSGDYLLGVEWLSLSARPI